MGKVNIVAVIRRNADGKTIEHHTEYPSIDGVLFHWADGMGNYEPTIADCLEDFKRRVERDELPTESP